MSDWVLLIDYGTSFSRAAIVAADGRVEPVEVAGGPAMPSGVWVDSAGRLSAGLTARQQARLAPQRWDRAPKRALGSSKLPLGPKGVAVPAAIAQPLRQLGAAAIRRSGGAAPRAVRLVCQARVDAGGRAALLAAARLAGLAAPAVPGGVQLVDGPFAASRYLAERGKFPVGAQIAIFDLGGGGVETVVMERTEDRFVVRAVGGIAGLGGELFDDMLYQRVVAKVLTRPDPQLAERLLNPPNDEWRRAAEGLFREVRRAKEELSRVDRVQLEPVDSIDVRLDLTRIEVESLLRPEILRSARELAATIELAGLRPRGLAAIYLVGGASRMPLVAKVVFDVLGVHPTVLAEPTLLAGAATWTESDRIDPTVTPITASGQKFLPEPAEAEAGPLVPAAATLPGQGAGGPTAGRRRVPRRLGSLVAVAAVAALLGGWALKAAASDDDARSRSPQPPAATASSSAGPSASLTQGDLSPTMRAVTGLAATVRKTTVELRWRPVDGAASYEVRRDPGLPAEAIRRVSRSAFGDRPGDGDLHRYTVVALDRGGLPGPVGQPVQAKASAPYGDQQGIASVWTAIIPAKPGARGSAGQTCKALTTSSEQANGKIHCQFKNGVQFEIARYNSSLQRAAREQQLADGKGVKASRWKVSGASGNSVTGRILVGGGTKSAAPWRWWTFDSAPSFSMYATWPAHKPNELAGWWQKKAPFRL